MKYRIVLTLYIVLVQGQVNRNFRLVLNEMGPGRTSRAWYFHSPGITMKHLLSCYESVFVNEESTDWDLRYDCILSLRHVRT